MLPTEIVAVFCEHCTQLSPPYGQNAEIWMFRFVWRDHSTDASRSSIYATSEAQVKKVKQIKILTFETESRFSLREWEGSETETWKNTAGR